MKPEEIKSTIDRYAERLQRFGPVVQALGWRDAEQQQLRFSVMTDGLPHISGADVLDIGCGFGDLYVHLSHCGAAIKYVGCDICPGVLEVARTRHPQVQFDVRDVLEKPYPDGSFDYICISGIFNHRLSDNEQFLWQMLSTAYRMSSRGVVANMTTDQVDYKEDYLYYFNPERVLGLCRRLSRRVALRHDYPLHEFTVFIYRDK